MARPAKPTHLKELNGSAKHDPQRINKNEPKPVGGIGPAPKHFKALEVECWDFLVGCMFPGVMGMSDRPTMEIMARLFCRFRYGDYEKDSPLPALNGAELSRLDSLLGRYGMTPSDRSKIVLPKGEKQNPFEAL